MTELKASLNDLAAAAALVADHTQIPRSHVEKDFWIVEALRACHQVARARGVDIVFKGGTSLSKGYRLIERFSEDIDLIVVFDGDWSPDKRHSVFRAMAKAVGNALLAEPQVDAGQSERGVKRPAFFQYPTDQALADAGIRPEGILLELGTRGGTWPTDPLTVVSLITEFGPEVGIEPDYEEAEPVSVKMLHPKRTLVEKMLILHDAATNGDDQRKQITARHYYDVHQLLGQLGDDLDETEIDELVADVAERSAEVGLPVIHPPQNGLASSQAFDSEANPIAASSYQEQVLGQLVWPKAEKPSFTECCDRVRTLLARTQT